MRGKTVILTLLIAALWPLAAGAQTSSATCDQSACANGQCPCCQNGGCCQQPPAPKPAYHGPSPYTKLKTELAALKKRLDDLEGQPCEDTPCGATVGDLRTQLASARRSLDGLENDTAACKEKDKAHDAKLAELENQLASLGKRLDEVEDSARRGPGIGPDIGAIGVFSPSCRNYLGFLVGPRFSHRFRSDWEPALDADLALGTGDSPLGTKLRAGVGYHLLEPLVLEAGADALWVDIDKKMRATSAFILGDVGVRYEWRPFFVAGYGLIGAETGACGTCFAGGVMLKAGLLFR